MSSMNTLPGTNAEVNNGTASRRDRREALCGDVRSGAADVLKGRREPPPGILYNESPRRPGLHIAYEGNK